MITRIIKGACIIAGLFFIFLQSCNEQQTEETTTIADLYDIELGKSAEHLELLQSAASIKEMRKEFLLARRSFKKAEPILAFLDRDNYGFLNGPNILKVEEEDRTDIKIKSPKSFQTLEETLFADNVNEEEVKLIANILSERVSLVKGQANVSNLKKHHVLWMIRNTIARVALTGITGFDSPMLAQSLDEAVYNYETLLQMLEIDEESFQDKELLNKWKEEIERTIADLNNGDFDTFDRYTFIKNHSHKQLQLWNDTVKDWQVEFPFTLAMNNDIRSFFTGSTFNLQFFSDPKISRTLEKAALGKQLFYDVSLSKNKQMSCGTCHKQELAFTDGLQKSPGQKRNSPTLTYAALQQAMFYDKRLGNLEGQIVSVVNNETEFHSSLENIEQIVMNDKAYAKQFKEVYGNVKERHIRNAIAEYIRQLSFFDSKFDRNINDLEETLTPSEINGFNLFMGKAACGTCHFAPVFNGTVPPDFRETEIELLGVPETAVWENATIDPDKGCWDVYQTPEREYFFKTPSIRNIAYTAPYMHNGVYDSLEQVMKFYNVGGGAGIGIELELQTLPPDPLDLTDQEIADIIAFMKTLSDPIESFSY